MRFYLISDNVDTAVGMRLAGIEGEIVHDCDGVKAALDKAIHAGDVGIILITEKLYKLCFDYITDIKTKVAVPLITEIPDRHGRTGSSAFADAIREAIGIKI
ncbi:MAG TPA: V-type ATP synthase subunit F [Bacillota bacterium]|nr:V-type ATP synthase subunit F [Bacillota bacterium]HOK68535.1 V-type ATP synthase subunit F [Bacillota bacterium]HPP86073.1 V-type ATP synthase subunit F [Bacillota bacterium]